MADERTLAEALAAFGWTCGPEFWERYYTDPWVFNLVNAVEKLSTELARLGDRPTSAPSATLPCSRLSDGTDA